MSDNDADQAFGHRGNRDASIVNPKGRGTTDGTRSKLKAFLSEDDGATWIGGLMLEERKNCTYPDGFQAPDGTIYISYDFARGPNARIVLARFTEADILAGKLITPTSKLDLTAVQAHPRRK